MGEPSQSAPLPPPWGKKVTSELPYIEDLLPARRVLQGFPEDLLHKPSQVNFFRHLKTRNHILRSIFIPTRPEGRRIFVAVRMRSQLEFRIEDSVMSGIPFCCWLLRFSQQYLLAITALISIGDRLTGA